MAVQFFNVNQADVFGVQFQLHGDESGNSVVINLSKAPFKIDFDGTLPVDFVLDGVEDGKTAVATLEDTVDGPILTVTFTNTSDDSPAPILGVGQGVFITFKYASL